MRNKVINFLKSSPIILNICWKIAEIGLKIWSLFVPIKSKTMMFASFGGRKFDDSPRALYEEILKRKEFNDWNLIWTFVNPEEYEIPRGEKIKIDTPAFFKIMISSKVLISNSDMARGIPFERKGIIRVETWHGTPLKKICGEENQNSLGGKKKSKKTDNKTIRCAQSEFDREIFARIFHASRDAILLSDLPRNDELLKYCQDDIKKIRETLSIPKDKKVILYTPTYREYLVNENHNTYIAPPIDLKKWEEKLGGKYVLLMRTHYAVSEALGIKETEFIKDVSNYGKLNDLYVIADCMISDYSSTYFDYSILERPMFCFAYDLEEYEEKRGLYLKLEDALPCRIDRTEDELLDSIVNMDEVVTKRKVKAFHVKYTSYAGNASKVVVDEIVKRCIDF